MGLIQGFERNGDVSTAAYYDSNMRPLCFVLPLVMAHFAIAQEDTSRRSFEFIGCYELRVVGENQSKASNPKKNDLLPKRFELTLRPSTDKGAFVVRNLDSKAWDSSLMASLSSWNTGVDRTVHLVWSTGYVGYDVRLRRSGSELRGTAHYFTDTDPLPRNNRDTAVVAQRVGCKEPEK